MIIKSYKKKETELLITMRANNIYRVIRLKKGQEPDLSTELGYDCASEMFDYFMEQELENLK